MKAKRLESSASFLCDQVLELVGQLRRNEGGGFPVPHSDRTLQTLEEITSRFNCLVIGECLKQSDLGPHGREAVAEGISNSANCSFF
jgi:hypothetical protein